MKLSHCAVLLSLLVPSWCSPGDQLDEFEDCIQACEYTQCGTKDMASNSGFFNSYPYDSLNPLLRLLLWDCPSDCDYQCQQIVTELRLRDGEEVLQFHGKWPFKRLLGTQELASALFSLGNFLPHYQNLYRCYGYYQSSFGSLKILYWNIIIISAITSCAWFFSTIFHIRDLLITERLDYFFAGATVLGGFHGLLIRVCRLDRFAKRRHAVSIMCCLMYLYHFLRLNYDWSYTYNMRANITVAVLQYGLLLKMGYDHYKRDPKDPLWMKPLILIGTVVAAMSFEVFDFINLTFQVDAHALWHLFTIPPGFWLYDFLYADLETLKLGYKE